MPKAPGDIFGAGATLRLLPHLEWGGGSSQAVRKVMTRVCVSALNQVVEAAVAAAASLTELSGGWFWHEASIDVTAQTSQKKISGVIACPQNQGISSELELHCNCCPTLSGGR
jgi:hypothetical protein